MMDHRAAQSESIAKLIGVPGKRINMAPLILSKAPFLLMPLSGILLMDTL